MQRLAQSKKIGGGIEIGESIDEFRDSMERELLAEFDSKVSWQREAKLAIIRTFLTGIFSLQREGCMWWVFLGWPTWVGKTQLVKSFCEMLFWDATGFTMISGWKLKHPTNVSLFTGSEAGFIWYGNTPLFGDIRVHAPYNRAFKNNTLHPILKSVYAAINISVVLSDETEKMHPEITDALLSAMTDGAMEMSSGREIASKNEGIRHSINTDLRNTLFIFTSNIWEQDIARSKRSAIGFTDSSNSTWDHAMFLSQLEERFAPEFLGRMNHIVRCENASEEMILGVIAIHRKRINTALSPYYEGNLKIDISPAMQAEIVKRTQLDTEKSWLRPVVRMMEQVWDKMWLAIHNADAVFWHGFNWGNIIFDVHNGKTCIRLIKTRRAIEKIGINTPIDNDNLIQELVEKRISEQKKRVDTYMRLLSNYTPDFGDALKDIEKNLRENLGFKDEEIKTIRIKVFVDYHNATEKPSSSDEQLQPEDWTFEGTSLRALKWIISWLVKQWTNLAVIYDYIEGFMVRPIAQMELRYIAWYIQQQEMKRNIRIQ